MVDISFLKDIFKDKDFRLISPLEGGMMNHSLIVEDEKNHRYVLYIPTEQANEMVDRILEKDNQQIVINLGITSNNLYFDTTTGIKMNEYLSGDSLNRVDRYDVKKVARLLKDLHSSKVLSKKDYLPFERLNAFIEERKALIDDDFSHQEHDKLLALVFDQKDYLSSEKAVLSHNDFQKSNIIKTLENKYYVIDFEFMMNNYETYDIACFGNNDVKEGYELLKEYYLDELNDDKKKRYYLWRIFVSLQWYNVALIKHVRKEGEVHHMDFSLVAHHFYMNALEAYSEYLKLQ